MDGMSLQKTTQNMLLNRPKPVTLAAITKACPSLNIRWLSAFANGRVADPSVNKVQSLYEFLKGEPLLKI